MRVQQLLRGRRGVTTAENNSIEKQTWI